MEHLGLEENRDTYSSLVKAYSERNRYYHTGEHVNACLLEFDTVKHCAENPLEIELAIWFHDVIYKPFSSSNELDSALWATDFLSANDIDNNISSRVHDLIMGTCHTSSETVGDESLMVDIDLTILGAEPEVYDRFEKAIRQEYKLIPKFIYRKKRREILSSFLDREKIYQNSAFYTRLEKQARENIARAIQSL